MRSSRLFSFAAISLIILLAVSHAALAQRTTATVAGIVSDASGALIPGAQVELLNEGTGVSDRQLTSERGEFLFNYVPVGRYTITISMTGFKAYKSSGIALGAAQNLWRTFNLEIGTVAEMVSVTGQAPMIDAISSQQRVNLEPVEVGNLPSANRNISNILKIGSGITMQEGTTATRVRLNGLGGASTNITANGTDANGNNGSRMLSQYDGISKIDVMSMEAIGEVQVVKGVLPAEYAYAMGGNLNLTSKGGTNNWHGSLFYRYEGNVLSAKLPTLKQEPHSVWNQFGASFGGPIRHDKAFFFAAYEGYRQRTAEAVSANVPTQLLRNTTLQYLPAAEAQLFLDTYPLPNQSTAPGALLGVFSGSAPRINDDDHIDARVDLRLWNGNLSGTFTTGHPFLSRPTVLPTPETRRVYNSKTYRSSVIYSFARGDWSSETRFGVNYNYLKRAYAYAEVVDPTKPATIEGQRVISTFTIPGMTVPSAEVHTRGLLPTYSIEQQTGKIVGKHTFKFGGIYTRVGGGRVQFQGPAITFQSLADLKANDPASVSYVIGAPTTNWMYTNFGFYAQDDWRVHPHLVLNMGLRYDFFGRMRVQAVDKDVVAAVYNLGPLLDQNFNFGPPRDPQRPTENDAGINLGPRFGFSYSPGDSNNLAIRGGFGIMFQPIDSQILEGGITQQGIPQEWTFSRQDAAALGLKWPVYNEDLINMWLANPPGVPVGRLSDPYVQAPYAMTYTLGFQKSIGAQMVLESAYVGTRGVKFMMVRTYNEVNRITGLRPNPAIKTSAPYYTSNQNTNYNGWQTTLRRRFTNNFMFNLNYTWAKALSTTGGDNSNTFLYETVYNQDFFDINSNYGPSTGDVTHSFIGTVIYSTGKNPFNTSSIAAGLLGNWQISGVLRMETGLPLTITQSSALNGSRPDVVDASNAINRDFGSDNLQYLNPSAFQKVPVSSVSKATLWPGNAGNGEFRGPGFWGADMSLLKSLPLGEARQLELRADFLNAFNHPHWTTIQTNINASNFGKATATSYARTIQLQARFSF